MELVSSIEVEPDHHNQVECEEEVDLVCNCVVYNKAVNDEMGVLTDKVNSWPPGHGTVSKEQWVESPHFVGIKDAIV